MKHLEWKNFHSEILFSLLSRSYTVSDLQVTENFYKQFYNFTELSPYTLLICLFLFSRFVSVAVFA